MGFLERFNTLVNIIIRAIRGDYMKKVLIIGYMHLKYDKRVYRTVQALSKYAKVIYQYFMKEKESEYEEGNVRYVPIEKRSEPTKNILARLQRRRKFDNQVVDLIKNTDFDILYMHDFLLSKPIEPFEYARSIGKRVVYDIHEYHPEDFLWILSGPAGRLSTNVVRRLFERQIDLSDKLIFVSPELMRYSLGGRKKDVLIVPNYASMAVCSREKNKEIVFVGKTARVLGDQEQVIKKLINEGFIFKIIGMEPGAFSNIEHVYTGFLPYDEMMKEVSKAAFSLASFKSMGREDYKNDLWALPNKFYDSIAAGTPVVVMQSSVSMSKIVEELGIGVVIEPKDVEGSVKKILDAYDNYDKLVDNVERHKSKFVWDETKEKEFVEFVLG